MEAQHFVAQRRRILELLDYTGRRTSRIFCRQRKPKDFPVKEAGKIAVSEEIDNQGKYDQE